MAATEAAEVAAMSALAWLVFFGIVGALALMPLTYIAQDWAARTVGRHVTAAIGPDPFATTRQQIAELETTEERR